MLEGIEAWLVEQMVAKMKNKPMQQQRAIIKKTNNNFKLIRGAANIEQMDQPLV